MVFLSPELLDVQGPFGFLAPSSGLAALAGFDLSEWHPWHLWVLAGFLVMILEMITSGFMLACLAVGCFGAALSDLLGVHSLQPQIWICAAVTFLSFFLIRPLVMRTSRGVNADSNTDFMVGQRAVISETVDGDAIAMAKVNGEMWRLQANDGSKLAPGDSVRVVGVDGNRLMVERSDAASPPM